MPDGITLAWILFSVYLVATFYLAYLGHKHTEDFASFAVGKRDMSPGIAGLTLGACLASTQTFVLNPGLVYHFGISALFALTIPVFLGIFAGLALLGPGFREQGGKALTLPQWIGQRYDSDNLRTWVAVLNVLTFFYIVSIVSGAAIVMAKTMGLNGLSLFEGVEATGAGFSAYKLSLLIVVGVVFTYVFFGGTYAHAYTNTAQGAIMLVVAIIIGGYALGDIFGADAEAVKAVTEKRPDYFALFNPKSPISSDWLTTLVAPFVLGFMIISQPHLLIKSLYLKESKDMTKFLVVGGGSFVIFSLVMLSGVAARVTDPTGVVASDTVAAEWISRSLPGLLGAFVSVAILAAAMSTLDGLLVAVSSIIGADIVTHPKMREWLSIESEDDVNRASMNGGRIAIVVLGVGAALVSWFKPDNVALFGMFGLFGLLAATVPALVYGIWARRVPSAGVMGVASVVGLVVHLVLYGCGSAAKLGFDPETARWLAGYGTPSPILSAAAGMVIALPIPALLGLVFGRPVVEVVRSESLESAPSKDDTPEPVGDLEPVGA